MADINVKQIKERLAENKRMMETGELKPDKTKATGLPKPKAKPKPPALPYEKEWRRYQNSGGKLPRDKWQKEWETFMGV